MVSFKKIYLFSLIVLALFTVIVNLSQVRSENLYNNSLIQNNQNFIHSKNTLILDEKGKPIKLKGVNLGSWLLWEGWIWGGDRLSETQIYNGIKNLAGSQVAEDFRNSVYNNFITEDDIAYISKKGFNVVRIPLNHLLLEDDNQPFSYKESGWKVITRLIDWCEKYHIYVVLDLHSAPGGQSEAFHADPDKGNLLWNSSLNQERTVFLWKSIASHYKSRNIIAGYDLLNEPDPNDSKQLVSLYSHIVSAIREVDHNHMIIIEGANAARDFSMFYKPLTENMSFSFHMYTWHGENRQKQLKEFCKVAKKYKIPMWNGEFGENTYEMIQSTVSLFNQSDISGYCFWPWKKVFKSDIHPCLNCIVESPKWDKLINWVSHPDLNNKPTKKEVQEAIDEFVSAISFSKNIKNEKMYRVINN